MKRITICISLLALAVFVAGCTQAKKPGTTGKPAATSQADQTATTPHTTMKPVTPATGSGQQATTPVAGTPEAKPAAAATETPANTEKSTEKK